MAWVLGVGGVWVEGGLGSRGWGRLGSRWLGFSGLGFSDGGLGSRGWDFLVAVVVDGGLGFGLGVGGGAVGMGCRGFARGMGCRGSCAQ